MPTAWDPPGRHATADKDPLRNLLDFNNIDQTIERSGDLIRSGVLNVILQFTGLDLSSPEAFITSLIDVITTGGPAAEFATALLGIFTDAIGIGPLEDVLPHIKDLLGNPDLGGGFDLLAALTGLINNRLTLPGLLVHRNDVLGVGGFPYTFPIDWSAPGGLFTPQGLWFERLRALLGTDLIRPDFTLATALQQLITNSLLPQNLLAQLVNGRLPDNQAPPVVQALIDAFAQIFLGLNTVNNGFPLLRQALQAIFGGYTAAQASATTAASTATAALAATTTPGVSNTDFFDYTAGTVGSPYTTRYVGGGASGTLVWDGAGKLDWSVAGGITRQGFFVDATHATTTDNQEVTQVFGRVIEEPSGGDQSYNYVLGRVNSAGTIYVAGRIGYNTAQIVYDTGTGFINTLGSSAAITPSPSDSWTLKCGVSGTARRFTLKQNGVTVCDATDTTNTAIGASNRYGGGAMQAGSRNFGSTQTKPANIDSLTVADAA